MMDKKYRILIVDDAATIRLYHRNILEGAGFFVDEAINGLEALEKILINPHYDLFLVDVNMPKIDGYTFLRNLRKMDIRQSPAIMISTEAQERDKDVAFKAGANFYIIKPVKPNYLIKLCRLFIGDGEHRDE